MDGCSLPQPDRHPSGRQRSRTVTPVTPGESHEQRCAEPALAARGEDVARIAARVTVLDSSGQRVRRVL